MERTRRQINTKGVKISLDVLFFASGHIFQRFYYWDLYSICYSMACAQDSKNDKIVIFISAVKLTLFFNLPLIEMYLVLNLNLWMKIAQHEFDEIWLERWLMNITLTTSPEIPTRQSRVPPSQIWAPFSTSGLVYPGETAKVVSIIVISFDIN